MGEAKRRREAIARGEPDPGPSVAPKEVSETPLRTSGRGIASTIIALATMLGGSALQGAENIAREDNRKRRR